ncbi:MAG: hypothetical protein Q8930_14005 [Bacillota bacterium]|nr:hypothetical protein [Bacillota bacterium]
MPKKLTWNELYATNLFVYGFIALTGMTFNLKYDLYGYFAKGVQWMGLLEQLVIPTAANTIILNITLLILNLKLVRWKQNEVPKRYTGNKEK